MNKHKGEEVQLASLQTQSLPDRLDASGRVTKKNHIPVTKEVRPVQLIHPQQCRLMGWV
jgi:hypothetical protein